MSRAALTAAGTLIVCALIAASARAAPSVTLRASLHPERPGAATTVRLAMQIAPGSGETVPPALAEASLRYPAGLEVTLSGLGIEACSQATLRLLGPTGCPPDSRMGYGSATAAVQIEGEVVHERARIAILRGAEREGHVSMLIVAYGEPAVSEQIVMPTLLLPAESPFGGSLAIRAPAIGTFPGGPDLAVTSIELVLGPKRLRYTERIHGRITHYKPAGIPLPEHCPHGGFRFTVQMGFFGGSHAQASTSVACPLNDRFRAGGRGRGWAHAGAIRRARR